VNLVVCEIDFYFRLQTKQIFYFLHTSIMNETVYYCSSFCFLYFISCVKRISSSLLKGLPHLAVFARCKIAQFLCVMCLYI